LIKVTAPAVHVLNKYQTGLDSFGCKQLDRLENLVLNPLKKVTVEPVGKVLAKLVCGPAESLREAIQATELSQYAHESLDNIVSKQKRHKKFKKTQDRIEAFISGSVDSSEGKTERKQYQKKKWAAFEFLAIARTVIFQLISSLFYIAMLLVSSLLPNSSSKKSSGSIGTEITNVVRETIEELKGARSQTMQLLKAQLYSLWEPFSTTKLGAFVLLLLGFLAEKCIWILDKFALNSAPEREPSEENEVSGMSIKFEEEIEEVTEEEEEKQGEVGFKKTKNSDREDEKPLQKKNKGRKDTEKIPLRDQEELGSKLSSDKKPQVTKRKNKNKKNEDKPHTKKQKGQKEEEEEIVLAGGGGGEEPMIVLTTQKEFFPVSDN